MALPSSLIESINRQHSVTRIVLALWLFLVLLVATGADGYLKISENIGVAVKERQGNRDVRYLADLLYDLARLRLGLLSVESNPESVGRIKALADKITADIDANVAGVNAYQRLQGHDRQAESWKDALRGMIKDPGIRHEQLAAGMMHDVRALISEIAKASHLILDPSYDSYYLMDMAVLAMPDVVDVTSETARFLHDRQEAAESNEEPYYPQGENLYKEQLSYLSFTRIPASMESSSYGYAHGDIDDFYKTLRPVVEGFSAASHVLLDVLSAAHGEELAVHPDNAVMDMLERSQDVSHEASAALESILSARIHDMKMQRLQSAGWSFTVTSLIMMVVTMIFRCCRDVGRIDDQKRLLDLVLKASQDGIWQKNFETGEFHISRRFLQIFGYDVDTDVSPVHVLELVFSPEDLAVIHDAAQRACGGEVVNLQRLMSGRHKDGSGRQILCRILSECNREGRVVRMVGGVTDVTELAQARVDVDDARAIRNLFLNNVTHEIMSPINGIIGMAEVMRLTDMTDRQNHFMDVITSSSDNLLIMMNDLLDISRYEQPWVFAVDVPFDLRALCQQVSEVMQTQAHKKGVSFVLMHDERCGRYYCGDPLRLHRVILKLCESVIKLTSENYVSLSISYVRESASHAVVRFSVEDRGAGLFQASQSADAGWEIPLCQRLLKAMGSSMQIQNMADKGVTFSFDLLLGTVKGVPENPDTSWKLPQMQVNWHRYKNIRVLVADGIPVNREIMAEMLAPYGIGVDIAADGHEAILMFDKGVYDLVFLACRMPKLNGFEVGRYIRKSGHCASVPIIVLAAGPFEADKSACMEAGISDSLFFPVRGSKIDDLLQKWLPISSRGDI